MTLESNLSKVVFNGNGAATEFPFTFKVWDAGQIAVTVSGPDGYAEDVTAGAAIVLDADAGGTVTYLQDGAPLPSGYKLAITRNMPFLQRVDLVSATRFDPQVMEDALDTAAAERQELREKVDRAVLVDATDARTPAEYSRDFWAAHDDVLTMRDNVEEMLREIGTEVGTHSYVTSSGSTTARTLGDRFADIINVKDFGATGDGVTDDTAAIQAALDYAKSQGKPCFATGEYKVTSTIYINSTCYFSEATFKADGASVSPVLGVGSKTYNQGFLPRQVRFELPKVENIGRDYNSAWTGYTDSIGVQIYNAAECEFRISKISKFWKGLYLSAWGTCLAYCTFYLDYLECNHTNLIIDIVDETDSDGTVHSGWVNQNLFLGGAIRAIQ
ncbi:MAG: hypothetical protein E7022_05870 [Desulfovibrio desulfuricans]|nr:hypothetical protein [Desulfovibrio desulfuricans]